MLGGLAVEMVDTLRARAVGAPSTERGRARRRRLRVAGDGLFAGLLAYVLAEVFARGVVLREDVEATI